MTRLFDTLINEVKSKMSPGFAITCLKLPIWKSCLADTVTDTFMHKSDAFAMQIRIIVPKFRSKFTS